MKRIIYYVAVGSLPENKVKARLDEAMNDEAKWKLAPDEVLIVIPIRDGNSFVEVLY